MRRRGLIRHFDRIGVGTDGLANETTFETARAQQTAAQIRRELRADHPARRGSGAAPREGQSHERD